MMPTPEFSNADFDRYTVARSSDERTKAAGTDPQRPVLSNVPRRPRGSSAPTKLVERVSAPPRTVDQIDMATALRSAREILGDLQLHAAFVPSLHNARFVHAGLWGDSLITRHSGDTLSGGGEAFSKHTATRIASSTVGGALFYELFEGDAIYGSADRMFEAVIASATQKTAAIAAKRTSSVAELSLKDLRALLDAASSNHEDASDMVALERFLFKNVRQISSLADDARPISHLNDEQLALFTKALVTLEGAFDLAVVRQIVGKMLKTSDASVRYSIIEGLDQSNSSLANDMLSEHLLHEKNEGIKQLIRAIVD